jgi:hypothetical protein
VTSRRRIPQAPTLSLPFKSRIETRTLPLATAVIQVAMAHSTPMPRPVMLSSEARAETPDQQATTQSRLGENPYSTSVMGSTSAPGRRRSQIEQRSTAGRRRGCREQRRQAIERSVRRPARDEGGRGESGE